MASTTGRFVWYELLTSDVRAAVAYYTEVVGWKAQLFDNGPAPYTMWTASQGPLGGVYDLPDQAKQMGAPPHWTAHVDVADVDKACAKVKELGGKVYVEPHDIPTVGRYGVIADPQGATICVFKGARPMEPHDPTKAGEFCWHELMTSDHAAGFEFYKTLFGWEKKDEFDMGPMGKYWLFGQGDKTYGGMMTKPADMKMPPAWIYYAEVADLDAAVERAKSKGGKLVNGPMDVPGGTRIAQLFDPQGAFFALHTTTKK